METKENYLNELKKEIPYQWRVQSFSKQKASCTCVAYIDARDVMNLLDEVVKPENWQDKFEIINGQLFCHIGIKCNGEWIWKTDTGTESQTEKEKGLVSDSFKRAAVKWGVGRFLYSLEIQYLKTNEAKTTSNSPFPIDDSGKRIWDISKFINDKLKSGVKLSIPEKDKQETKTPAKPVLTEKPYLQAIERITKGEKGVKEKLEAAFTIPAEYQKKINEIVEKYKGVSK